MRKYDEFPDKDNTKIFLHNSFSVELEEMGIRNIKGSGIAGYKVQYGPFENLSALNRSKNLSTTLIAGGKY